MSHLNHRTVPLVVASVLCLGFGSSQVYSLLAPEQSPPPLAIFEPSLVDFGEVRQNEVLSTELVLRNTTDGPIQIAGHHTTCKCTELPGDLLGRKLEPGEQLAVPVGMRTDASADAVSSKITMFLRPYPPVDKNVSVAPAVLRATVVPDFRFEPDHLDLGEIETSEPVERTIHLVPMANKDVRIVGVRCPEREITVSLHETAGERQGHCMLVKIDASDIHSRRPTSGRIYVETSSDRAKNVSIGVHGRVVPEVELKPEEIVITGRGGGEPAVVTIHTAQPSVLRSAECTLAECDIRTDLDAVSTIHKLSVSLPGEGPVDGEIHVELGVSDETNTQEAERRKPSGKVHGELGVSEKGDGEYQARRLVIPIHRLEIKGG